MSLNDKNAKVLFLDSRQLNNTAKRIIKSTLIEIERQRVKALGSEAFELRKAEAIRNALFLKFIGADYEGVFQPYFKNRKVHE